MDDSEWKANLEREREEKDRAFASHWQSPLPPQERANFKGLAYYPADSAYRFELDLYEHEEKKIVKMDYTKGHEKEFIRWGEFYITISDKQQALQAYKSHPDEDRLFILFKDLTSGNETYGGGRYLDLEPERELSPDGKWILDFNRAYNPWCVYSKDFTCPLVPQENWLEVPIHAGEKEYPLKHIGGLNEGI
jgi:uncharacterized protein (DUF1684 family)